MSHMEIVERSVAMTAASGRAHGPNARLLDCADNAIALTLSFLQPFDLVVAARACSRTWSLLSDAVRMRATHLELGAGVTSALSLHHAEVIVLRLATNPAAPTARLPPTPPTLQGYTFIFELHLSRGELDHTMLRLSSTGSPSVDFTQEQNAQLRYFLGSEAGDGHAGLDCFVHKNATNEMFSLLDSNVCTLEDVEQQSSGGRRYMQCYFATQEMTELLDVAIPSPLNVHARRRQWDGQDTSSMELVLGVDCLVDLEPRKEHGPLLEGDPRNQTWPMYYEGYTYIEAVDEPAIPDLEDAAEQSAGHQFKTHPAGELLCTPGLCLQLIRSGEDVHDHLDDVALAKFLDFCYFAQRP